MNQILKTNSFESVILKKAEGSWIWDINGKKYLDCESGMWCVNLGHNHPRVIQDMKIQLDKIIHRNKGFLTPITIEAAEELLKFMPIQYDKLTFLNSGTEAMEFGINFAKKVTKRDKVLTLKDSYLGAYGTAKKSSYTSSEESTFKISYPICNSEPCSCLEVYQPNIDKIFHEYPSDFACLILEPVMVSGGVIKPCKAFIQYICKKIKESGGLIVIDEVTTGMGRTGYKFGYQLFDITPDVVVLGKALGNGYPISAIITNSTFESKLSPAELYYAQSHQLDPLGAAVVKSVVSVFNEEQIIENSKDSIQKLSDFLITLNQPFVKEIRSTGMIFGIQIQPYRGMGSEEIILKLKNLLLDAGMLIGFNLSREFIRLLPTLNIKEDEIEFLKNRMKKIFESI
ncbi:MAG: aminotransferase class III-fold pyridoxal phosphate-dependent enzyme [Promethearchaeota archaeon]